MELNIGGEYCYVSPGDLLIARARKIASEACFPLRHYHGLIVRVDVQQTPHCLSCILQDVNVRESTANNGKREGILSGSQ